MSGPRRALLIGLVIVGAVRGLVVTGIAGLAVVVAVMRPDPEPTALAGDCPRRFDFDSTKQQPIGDSDRFFDEARTASQAGAPVSFGELTRRAGWQDWDRVVTVPADIRGAALNASVGATDICWESLPKSDYYWESDSAWTYGYYLFFQGDSPRYAMLYYPSVTPLTHSERSSETFFPDTTLTPTVTRTSIPRLSPVG
ncbi:hypothetical protein ACWDOP_02855 [Nocardia sp. NPDC003693]